MDVYVLHNEGEDFGTLEVTLRRDDSASLSFGVDREGFLKLPLYSHEARELIEALRPIAEAVELS